MNKNNQKEFDIIVIGGGHAGIEASLISTRLGHKVALITLDKKKIGLMPCNPSVGGVAKGIVVREIDALGGEMGKAADATALQFKLLNTSNGPAVQALRVQSDKVAYARYMQKVVSEQKNLTTIEGAVKNLLITKKKIRGVELNSGETFSAKVVILTTGTYLRPIIYRGQENKIEGPSGEKEVVNNISQQLIELGFRLDRFKTGTSPRILKNSIDYSQFKIEPGTNLPLRFSSRSGYSQLLSFSQQLPCYLLHTNKKTHQIIQENLHLSPIFSGESIGTGPRRCPSIEHKIHYFADKEKHQIFVEPQSQIKGSKEEESVYLQGLSTSLPVEIQKKILLTLPGFEKAQVQEWGKAIGYDKIDATQLKNSLESKLVNGLFVAGQINGTTGYEEAAAQGLMAGINASQKLKKRKPLVLKRSEAYIGVLIDDLTTNKIIDPYRLLTSLAEHRLLLRHDNVYTRLWVITRRLGLLSEKDWMALQKKKKNQKKISQELQKLVLKADRNLTQKFPQLDPNQRKSAKMINGYDLLKNNKISLKGFQFWIPKIKSLNWEEQRELAANIKYAPQLERLKREIKELNKHETRKIPAKIDYEKIVNLTKEAREKLIRIKPVSLGQARRIGGVSPVDIQMLNYYLEQNYSPEN
ncbi:MAG: tRNA uridine-5-carboxymethylaminomethyl(34) synthesis enzyme MnmG [Candidatus Moeniiplasma glomeromycotorum]|nr:tRNA uridine-5-carboxymethylaminomethyl(34) synthesis enzyme MnmG [Candidatus Moeniiplasma glomeromycotorum]MCE8169845.1 tRNA uridine-5-carboxymethylaminomethyl(34) synthesis enzyme MnmG [Candidatus Moeniiplasma glomeromycotorum]